MKEMKCIWLLLCLLCLNACVDKIEFPVGEQEEVVVVDGTFSASDGQKLIKISTTIPVNSQVNIPLQGAQVFVEDDQGLQFEFMELLPGSYVSDDKAHPDRSYRLMAELPDGRSITSNFQNVPDSFSIKEIVTNDTLVTFLNESGNDQRLRALDFNVIAQSASVDNDLFLRFSASTVYQVLETKCDPFHNPKPCYFYNDERPYAINLFEIGANTSPSDIESLVLRRQIDYRLSERFALDLSLLSYNKEEYEYWQRLKQLFDQEGNINDVNPARLLGNISADDGSEILGQFAVVGRSRQIKFVSNADFPTQRLPFCGIAGNRPWPLPDACCECTLLPGASVDKPDFWP